MPELMVPIRFIANHANVTDKTGCITVHVARESFRGKELLHSCASTMCMHELQGIIIINFYQLGTEGRYTRGKACTRYLMCALLQTR